MADYTDLIEAAIQKMFTVTSEEVALRQARSVPDLDIDEDGNVNELRASGEDVLRELVDAYGEIMGGVAKSLIAYELRDRFDIDDIDLPENVSKHL